MLNPQIQSLTQMIVEKILSRYSEVSLSPLLCLALSIGLTLIAAFFAGITSFILAIFLLIAKLFIDGICDYYMRQDNPDALYAYVNDISHIFGFGLIIFVMGVGLQQNLAAGFAILSYLVLINTSQGTALHSIGKQETDLTIGQVAISPARLIEQAEAHIFMIIVMLIPSAFAPLAAFFGLMCWITLACKLYENIDDQRAQNDLDDLKEEPED